MPLFDHFDFLAPIYETVIRPTAPDKMIALAGLPVPGGKLLDAGGGTGRLAQFLVGTADAIVVADLSLPMLKGTRKKAGLQAVCSHTETLPFPDGSFTRIIMVDALHHVCNQSQTAAELWRTLQPGGRLIIEEPDIRSVLVKLIALGERLAFMRSRFLPQEEIAALFSYTGAKVCIRTAPHTIWVIVEKK